MLSTFSGIGYIIEYKFTCNEEVGDTIKRICCVEALDGDRAIHTLYTNVLIDHAYTNTVTDFTLLDLITV